MNVNWRILGDRLWPWIFFGGLTGLVTWPWFTHAGFIFLLDFVWPPMLPMPTGIWQNGFIFGQPYEWIWWLLTHVLPVALVQKIVLALPLWLCGVAMFHLVNYLTKRWALCNNSLQALIAGMFYALNPFMVTRIFMGQIYLLLAYALAPWALLLFLKAFIMPTRRRALLAGCLTALVMLTNGHHIFLLAMLFLPFMFSRYAIRWGWHWAWFTTPIWLFLLIAGVVHGSNVETATLFNSQGPMARALQAPYSGNLFLDTIFLTATWKTDLPFSFPYEILSGFGALATIWLIIMFIGVVTLQEHTELKWLKRSLLIIGGLSALLAIGVAHPLTKPVATWLFRFIPGWIGLRDSAKWISLVALVEAVLLGLGLAIIGNWLYRKNLLVSRMVMSFSLLTMAYFISPAFHSFGGQMLPLAYPDSWYEFNHLLFSQSKQPRILFLPWNAYSSFSFTDDRTVTNPARSFFQNSDMIVGDNSEVGGWYDTPLIHSESSRPLSKKIENILQQAPAITDLGAQLATEHIQYVMLAQDAFDAPNYDYLWRQTDLKIIFDKPDLVVWQNIAVTK